MKFESVYNLFFEPGEVCEIRAYGLSKSNKAWEGWAGGSGIVYGYFDNAESFAQAAGALEKAKAPGIYFTLNPVIPDLLARAANRLKAAGAKTVTTSDKEIQCIRWLPIDLDPKRPSGISSTDQELKASIALRNKIYKKIVGEMKWPGGIPAVSGNGAHLVFRIDPAYEITERDNVSEDPAAQKIKQCLAALNELFGTKQVDVDTVVFNPARIWKLYGTSARKGDHTDARPHRKSYIEAKFLKKTSELKQVEGAGPGLVDTLAGLAPQNDKKTEGHRSGKAEKSQPRGSSKADFGELDVEKYLSGHGITYNIKQRGDRTLYRLDHCLFDPGHGRNDAYIQVTPGAPLIYYCSHDSCNHTWADARRVISGDKSLREYMTGYDPDRRRSDSPPPASKDQDEKDEEPYFIQTADDKTKFVVAAMAKHLARKFKPIIYEGKDYTKQFFRYHKSGVWKFFPEAAIRKYLHQKLDKYSTPERIARSVTLFQDEVFAMPQELEFDPMWLNVQNTMLNVKTMETKPHAAEFMSRAQLPVSYIPPVKDQPGATCTLWIDKLLEIFEDGPEKCDVIQEFFGYCLYPKVIFPCALFQIGGGGNGKGLVERVLYSILGQENVSHISLARMEKDFGPVEIRNKLLNSCGETETKALDVTNFKKICSGDEIQAEVKFKADVKFTPVAKHMISMNAFPGIKDKTDAFFRRIIVLEYNQKFEGDNDDPFLFEKLMEMRDGIFLWALDGLKRVLDQKRIKIPETVTQAKFRFRSKVNPVLLFVDETCVRRKTARVSPPNLFEHYKTWVDESGLKPLGKTNFYEQILSNFGVRRIRPTNETKEVFQGIGLAYDPEPKIL